MVVEMRTLRITSDFNASSYVAGMNQKVEADKAGAQSSRAAGAAVDDLKIKVSSAVPLIERLSRTYVDGYGTAAKFNGEIMKLARSQDTNAASAGHLEQIYTGLQKKFGLIADSTELTSRGYAKLAQVIDTVNSRLGQMKGGEQATALAAQIEQLRQKLDPTYVASQRLTAELGDLAEAERLGVQITGGYERALEAIILKHDAAAAAAKRQRDEYTALAKEGRAAAAADRAQAGYNTMLGVGRGAGLRASDSAAIFSEQLGRQEEIARLRAQQQAEQFAADLRQRFSFDGAGGSARDSASVFAAEFARQDEMSRLRAQQQGAAFTSDLNARLGVDGNGTSARASAAAFEEAARASEQLDRRVAFLRAQIDPLAAAQNRLNAELAEYDDLARRGSITTGELGQAQTLARQRYDATANELDRQQRRGVRGLRSDQATNLLYQGTDVVQSLALGMPVLQVLFQQGPQIAQIFYETQGSLKAVLGLLNPLTLGLGAVAAAAAIGAVAWNGYLRSIKEVETASAGIGRATAGTSAQMEAAAQAGASAANISVASARSMEAQFLRTGRIGSEQFEELIALSKDFAITIGVDAGQAGAKLAEMFSNPAEAARTLYMQYGLIDAATARQVTNLTAQNRQSEAQAVLLNALPDRLAKASEATTALGRAWNFVTTGAGNALDAIGKAIDRSLSGPTPEERLAEAQAARARLQSSPWEMIDSFLNPGKFMQLGGIGEIDGLNEQIRRNNARAFEQQRRAQDVNRSRAAVQLGDASGANAEAVEIERLRNEIVALRSGQGLPGTDAGRIDSAIEAKSRVLESLINRQQRSIELDRLDIQIQTERNPLFRAELEARRMRLQMADQEIASARIEEEAQRARNRVMDETIAVARAQASDMQVELETRQQLAAEVAAGTIAASDANRILQEELTLRPLVIAEAAAEGQEKARLKAVLDDLRGGYAALAAQQKEETAAGIVRGQNEKLEDLRMEIALVGQSDLVRRRSLALLEAEQQIRREGLQGTGRAEEIRANAKAIADQTAEVERLRDAWQEVQGAIDGAINSGVDKLIDGDWKGALKDVSKEITGMLTTLGIKNPLANAADGGNRGTLSDLGGIGGLFGRLFGGATADPASLVQGVMGKSVGAMNVTAGVVNLNGGVGGLAGSLTGGNNTGPFDAILRGANDNTPLAMGGGVQSEIWNFFAGKGLKPHQIAGILGNVKAESNFNPLAIGDGGNAFGLFQHNDRSASLFNAIGGRGNLGNVQSQLDFVWKELQTTENGAFRRLLASNDVRSATSAFAGFERPQGWFLGNPEAAHNFIGRLNGANEALAKFGGSTNVATQGLGSLGNDFISFGKNLTSYFPAAPGGGMSGGGGGGGLFSWLGNIFGGGSQWSQAASGSIVGLFSDGGYTGPGGVNQPRGIVHAGEVVWSQQDVARAGGVAVVEGMRLGLTGYARGGSPDLHRSSRMPVPANSNWSRSSNASRPQITIVNQNGSRVEHEEREDSQGGRQDVFVISDAVGQAIARPGGGAGRALRQGYGLKPRGVRR